MIIPVPTLTVIAVMGLIGVGLYALLISRNMIKLVVALQILVKGAMLGLVLAGRINGQIALAQSMAVTVIVADTIVAVVALALIVQVRRHFGSLDIKALTTLRR
jgi:NADH:ubiquinone oxidoreductase subunit K